MNGGCPLAVVLPQIDAALLLSGGIMLFLWNTKTAENLMGSAPNLWTPLLRLLSSRKPELHFYSMLREHLLLVCRFLLFSSHYSEYVCVWNRCKIHSLPRWFPSFLSIWMCESVKNKPVLFPSECSCRRCETKQHHVFKKNPSLLPTSPTAFQYSHYCSRKTTLVVFSEHALGCLFDILNRFSGL